MQTNFTFQPSFENSDWKKKKFDTYVSKLMK